MVSRLHEKLSCDSSRQAGCANGPTCACELTQQFQQAVLRPGLRGPITTMTRFSAGVPISHHQTGTRSPLSLG